MPATFSAVAVFSAIATKPQRRNLWSTGDLIWEASDPYLYLRTTAQGRVIAGGEDGEFEDEEKRDALIPKRTKRISAKLAKLMPALDTTPAYRWTGCFGDSVTGLPTIGVIPGMKRCYAVLGYGGNGIAGFAPKPILAIQRSVIPAKAGI